MLPGFLPFKLGVVRVARAAPFWFVAPRPAHPQDAKQARPRRAGSWGNAGSIRKLANWADQPDCRLVSAQPLWMARPDVRVHATETA